MFLIQFLYRFVLFAYTNISLFTYIAYIALATPLSISSRIPHIHLSMYICIHLLFINFYFLHSISDFSGSAGSREQASKEADPQGLCLLHVWHHRYGRVCHLALS